MIPLVSVIVTTKNNEKIIERCLWSISRQSFSSFELIVVDNFSTDRTQEIAKRFTPRVYSCGPERSAQRNYGARKSRGKYLFFVDSDMELGADVVKCCVGQIDGCVAVAVQERDVGEGFWTRCKILEKSCYSLETDGIAARFVDARVFFALGGYDEQLTGPEDIDLHKRLVERGKVGFCSVPITHHEGRLTLASIVRKRYYYSLSLRHYLKKHPRIAGTEFRIIRPAFLRAWKRLLRDPVHLIGMVVMRCFEGAAVVLALWRSTRYTRKD